MFFAAFFGALFYARVLSVEWLGGAGKHFATHEFLWPEFVASWPLSVVPDPAKWSAYKEIIPAVGVPLINTIILLSSGGTVTFAHWALKKGNRTALCWWLFATLALGFLFVGLQAWEYHHAYTEMSLKLSSGIYGTTFFMLTGFHGLHVTIGATMLTVIWARSLRGHFTAENHFAFVRRLQTCKNLHERTFAAAVLSDQAQAVSLGDVQAEILKKGTGAIGLRNPQTTQERGHSFYGSVRLVFILKSPALAQAHLKRTFHPSDMESDCIVVICGYATNAIPPPDSRNSRVEFRLRRSQSAPRREGDSSELCVTI